MRGWMFVLALCGCDGVLGFGSPVQADARKQFFDAPSDSPFACVSGSTPAFSSLIHPYIAQSCTSYTHSSAANRAAALCASPTLTVSVGPIGGPLAAATGVDVLSPPDILVQAWLVPEGDVLIVYEFVGGANRYRRYAHQPDDSWLAIADLNLSTAGSTFSGLSLGPTPHLVHYDVNANFEELADDGSNTWATHVHAYTKAELNVALFDSPHLSGDGLRLIFVGASPATPSMQQMFFTDRRTIADTFRAAEPLQNVPLDVDAFLFDDCSRIVFSTGPLDYVQHA
jgi:hypothetical protein